MLGLGTDYYDDLQTLNFIACEERGCTLISIVDDDIAESEEQFIIHLERAQDLDYRIIPSTKSAEVIITDDDGMSLVLLKCLISKQLLLDSVEPVYSNTVNTKYIG